MSTSAVVSRTYNALQVRDSVARKQLASQLKLAGKESAMGAAMKLIGSKDSALLRGAWMGWMEDYRAARDAKRLQSSMGSRAAAPSHRVQSPRTNARVGPVP